MRHKILVIGSSNVDLIMKMDRLPSLGETITDAEFIQTFGGKGANQAVGAARAGGDVIFVTCVGDDAYTPQMLKNYVDDGIDSSFIFKDKGIATGHALVMIGGDGHNYLSVAPGANYNLTPQRINEISELFDSAAIVVIQYEIPQDTIAQILKIAKEKKVQVLWNIAPARSFDLIDLASVDILVANETEGEFLSGVKISDLDSATRAAKVCIEKGMKLVIITMGKNGSVAVSEDFVHYVPAYEVEAIDTTAAGDVFCGSFVTALVENKSVEEAMYFATAASALCVTQLGAQPSAPRRDDIEHFIQEMANEKSR